jgi:hypothetical protein
MKTTQSVLERTVVTIAMATNAATSEHQLATINPDAANQWPADDDVRVHEESRGNHSDANQAAGVDVGGSLAGLGLWNHCNN